MVLNFFQDLYDSLLKKTNRKLINDSSFVVTDSSNDLYYSLGYKSCWIAVKTSSISFNTIKDIFKELTSELLVFESINGWTIISGETLPELDGYKGSYTLLTILEELSITFGESQYFGNHRTVGYYAWVKFVKGEFIRGYAHLSEKGITFLDHGEELTTIEKRLFNELEGESFLPDEDTVLSIAEDWSIIPEDLKKINHPI